MFNNIGRVKVQKASPDQYSYSIGDALRDGKPVQNIMHRPIFLDSSLFTKNEKSSRTENRVEETGNQHARSRQARPNRVAVVQLVGDKA